MIDFISIILAIISILALALAPQLGILATYFARPFVDTAWGFPVLLGFKLTELVSVAVPLVTITLVLLNFRTQKSVGKMPLLNIWLAYILFIICISISIAINSSASDAASLFFRYLNGFSGFYLAQAYYLQEKKIKLFFLVLALTGVFPIAQGLYEAITGFHWSITSAEGEIRNIGMYHDAITIRYYGLQTLLACAACLALNYPKNRVMKTAIYGILFLALFIVYKALSKAGILTLALWLLIWSYGRKSWQLPVIAAGAALVVIPFYFSTIAETLYNQFHKEIGALNGQVEASHTFAGRWYLWEQMWKEWSQFTFLQKMFGSGNAAFGAHNDYIQMLFTGGYFGLTLYISFLATIGWKLIRLYLRTRNTLSILALMAFSMWMVDAIGLVPSLYSGYQWFVWGVIGLCLRQEQEREIYKPTSPNIKYKAQFC